MKPCECQLMSTRLIKLVYRVKKKKLYSEVHLVVLESKSALSLNAYNINDVVL